MAAEAQKGMLVRSLGGVRVVVIANSLAIVFGILLGMYKSYFPDTFLEVLGVLAWLPVSLIKGFATPLLFFAVFTGLTADQPLMGGIKRLFFICLINACFAILIGMILVNVLLPGKYLTSIVSSFASDSAASKLFSVKTTNWVDAIKSFIPDSVLAPFVSNNIPQVLVVAVLLGSAARLGGRDGDQWHRWFMKLRDGLETGFMIVSRVLSLILIVMPIAIFSAVAKAVGDHGFSVFEGLSWYVGVCVFGMLLHVVLVYQAWIVFRAKRSLVEFWRCARLPVIYSFGVNSSLSALPGTLDALEKLRCSKTSAQLGACVGTNFNNDGILLYEVAAVLMLGQAFAMDWTVLEQLWFSLVCVLATFGVSGFPEAGIVALSLALPAAGLPVELMPLLLPVDWLVARCRSATNVLSDMTVSLAIDGPEPNRS